jgi:uncharacterized protein YecE (DUF72 family)
MTLRRPAGDAPEARRGEFRVGCSGYEYRDWKGRFYPAGLPPREHLAYYASQFPTVELNNTFYRLPTEAAVKGWRDRAPEGFCFAVKLSQFGTHRKRLREPGWWLPRYLERVCVLGPALGPVLVQLPPLWGANPERLDEFLTVAPSDLRWAVEVRDKSWLRDDVYDVLRRHDAPLVHHDLIPDHPRVETASWSYLRFHGPDSSRPYHQSYSPQALAATADRIAARLDNGADVCAYFNNDIGAAAPADAQRLARYVTNREMRPRAG